MSRISIRQTRANTTNNNRRITYRLRKLSPISHHLRHQVRILSTRTNPIRTRLHRYQRHHQISHTQVSLSHRLTTFPNIRPRNAARPHRRTASLISIRRNQHTATRIRLSNATITHMGNTLRTSLTLRTDRVNLTLLTQTNSRPHTTTMRTQTHTRQRIRMRQRITQSQLHIHLHSNTHMLTQTRTQVRVIHNKMKNMTQPKSIMTLSRTTSRLKHNSQRFRKPLPTTNSRTFFARPTRRPSALADLPKGD